MICVVEEPTNIATIEKTRSYGGVYHVLHGTLSPVNGVGPEQLRIANLLTRLDGGGRGDPGDVADDRRRGYGRLPRAGSSSACGRDCEVTRIATGVPAGSDIEYADEVTMSRAMDGRREV